MLKNIFTIMAGLINLLIISGMKDMEKSEKSYCIVTVILITFLVLR